MTRWWRSRSLRLRLTVVSALVLALGLSVGVLGLGVLFARARVADLDAELTAQAATLAALVRSDQLTQPLPVPPGSPVLAQVVDSAGTVLASTPAAGRVLSLVPPAAAARLSGRGATTADETGYGAGRLRVLVLPATLSGTPVHVVAAASLADLDSTLGQLRRVLLVVTPLTVLAAALASWLALGAALRPVDEMREAAEAIGWSGDPALARGTLPVPPTDDELGRLATTLNRMLDRLEASARQQRDFASDAAHELRTPLATLLTELDVARAGGSSTDWDTASQAAIAQGHRLSDLIDDLLLLARADADRLGRTEPVDLVGLASEQVDRIRARCSSDARHLVLTCEVPDGAVVVDGDQAALERLLTNLLENAVRHASATVVTKVGTDGRTATVTVTDDGPGVPDDELDAIFTRFHRVDPSRSRAGGGSGLGLAIVRGVARSHGGDATATNTPGGGLRVHVALAPVRGRTVT